MLAYLRGAGVIAAVVFTAGGVMSDQTTQLFRYDTIKSLSVEAITGRITVRAYGVKEVTVELKNELRNPDILTPEIEEKDGALFIKEVIPVNDPEGATYWTIQVPQAMSLESVDGLTALGDIEFDGLRVDRVKSHAATGSVKARALRAKTMELSTSSRAITVSDCRVADSIKLATSDGVVDLSLPQLPAGLMEAASSYGEVTITLPSFGDNFEMTISKNANQGKIDMPFACSKTVTKRFHEKDTYLTDQCTVKHGSGGPKVFLLTGSGTITIKTNTK